MEEITIKPAAKKNKALNGAAVVSAREFSVAEAVRYALRERNFQSLTGLSHTYFFFNPNTSGKLTLTVTGFGSKYRENCGKPR